MKQSVRRARAKPPSQAELVGEKTLAGFARGRTLAIAQAKERSAKRAAAIVLLNNEDVARGQPARGRAGRIARRMTDRISERQVRRILDTLSCVADSSR
jgi:hypothetical protein